MTSVACTHIQLSSGNKHLKFRDNLVCSVRFSDLGTTFKLEYGLKELCPAAGCKTLSVDKQYCEQCYLIHYSQLTK